MECQQATMPVISNNLKHVKAPLVVELDITAINQQLKTYGKMSKPILRHQSYLLFVQTGDNRESILYGHLEYSSKTSNEK